jgi:hypothetical protein
MVFQRRGDGLLASRPHVASGFCPSFTMVSNIAPLPPDEEGTSLSRLWRIETPSDPRQMA